MMLDWEDYQKQLLAGFTEIARINPDILKGYHGLVGAGNKTNVLEPKIRELIALAVSVTRMCDGCIVTHTDAAIKQGATKEEIVEALGVAIAVNAGSAFVYSTRVMDAFAEKTKAE